MNFIKVIKFVINEADTVLKTTANKPIVDAIKNRRKITFDYYGPRKPKKDSVKPGKRIEVEPVAMGASKKGNLILRAWIEPPSVTKTGFGKGHWRTFMLSRMRNIDISDKTFDTKRPGYKEGNDSSMSVTYVTSDWVKKPRIKKYEKPTTKPKPVSKIEPIVKKEPEKVEPKPTPQELPQPKPEEKPKPPSEVQPTQEPTPQVTPQVEPETQELPEPKPEDKPEENPEDEEKENLSEEIKRIKSLMFS